ncbi:MAG: hypothetical protein Q8N32_09000 [Sulfuricurvum sp.]|nr:hypothetical protein [Sulfuricurvum sp.]
MKRSLYFFYIFLIIIIVIPKERLYFAFESFLGEYHLFINNEDFSNRLFYVDINNGEVLLDNQEFAKIEHMRIAPWIILNRFTLTNIVFSPLFQNFFPGKIDSITLTYSLLDPLRIKIVGDGDFGHCSGSFDMIEHKMRVIFEATSQLRDYPLLVNKLHQEKEGLVYEQIF